MRSMSVDKPLVSIITPSYNQGTFLRANLITVQQQTYHPIEHIIIDGGSTDATLAIVKKYENTYNMRWISERDRGQGDAVNKGFAMARGEIIGWLNSDDLYFRRDTIASVVGMFSQMPDVDILYGDAVTVDTLGGIRRVRRLPGFSHSRLLRLCYLVQPAVFLRAHVVRSCKLDVSLETAMDYEFWLRLAGGHKFLHFNEILACDRNHLCRKIIARRSTVVKESRDLRVKYGQAFGIRYAAGRAIDKLVAGYLRVRGLADVLRLQMRPQGDLSTPLRARCIVGSLADQLFGKDLRKT